MSPKLMVTRSLTGSMLKRFAPYSGIIASTRVTRAPHPTRRMARLDPMKPSPPVISTRAPRKTAGSSSAGTAHLLERVPNRFGNEVDVAVPQPDVQGEGQDFVGQPLGDRQRAAAVAEVRIRRLEV